MSRYIPVTRLRLDLQCDTHFTGLCQDFRSWTLTSLSVDGRLICLINSPSKGEQLKNPKGCEYLCRDYTPYVQDQISTRFFFFSLFS